MDMGSPLTVDDITADLATDRIEDKVELQDGLDTDDVKCTLNDGENFGDDDDDVDVEAADKDEMLNNLGDEDDDDDDATGKTPGGVLSSSFYSFCDSTRICSRYVDQGRPHRCGVLRQGLSRNGRVNGASYGRQAGGAPQEQGAQEVDGQRARAPDQATPRSTARESCAIPL